MVVMLTCLQLTLKGRYDEALRQMNGFDEDILRNLKRQQHWITFIELVKLRRSIHRYFTNPSNYLSPHNIYHKE